MKNICEKNKTVENFGIKKTKNAKTYENKNNTWKHVKDCEKNIEKVHTVKNQKNPTNMKK